MVTFAVLCVAEEHLVTEELNWLKYNTQPWMEVLEKWKTTSSFRVSSFNRGLKTIGAFTTLSNPKMDSLASI